MSILNILQAVGAGLTGFGALIVIGQLYQRKRQFTTEFEDKLTSDYRNIIYRLPVAALLDDSDEEEQYIGDLDDYYRYIDLTNDQIFLRQEGRISKSTWENWSDGIETILGKSNFEVAWEEIHERESESFSELQKFLCDEHPDDPRYWEHPWRAKIEAAWFRIWNW